MAVLVAPKGDPTKDRLLPGVLTAKLLGDAEGPDCKVPVRYHEVSVRVPEAVVAIARSVNELRMYGCNGKALRWAASAHPQPEVRVLLVMHTANARRAAAFSTDMEVASWAKAANLYEVVQLMDAT